VGAGLLCYAPYSFPEKLVVITIALGNAAEQILNGSNSLAGERQRFGRNRIVFNSVDLGSADGATATAAGKLQSL
jgi:hypothetical protein